MLFNSLQFLVFFAVVYGLYLATMKKLRVQNAMLLAASYFFYGSWDWRFLGLLFASTAIDFACGRALDRRASGGGDDAPYAMSPRARKGWLAFSLTVNLGILGFFKYFDFFAGGAASLLAAAGVEAHAPTLRVVLPVGISFYTFQSMAYAIDVYRGQCRAERSFTNFALAVAFFAHLVAGPIQRASNLIEQMRRPRTITRAGLEDGAWLVFWGLFKKIFVADNLARLVELGFADGKSGGGAALVAVYAFAFQIYCDFSGYSDIARGLAKAMGFELMVNFDLPYSATNPADFWRRWHISLSTWLRDYLYVPLGGNRHGARATYRNLLLTMVLGGLWHGANWTFVVWGAFHGLLLVVHRWWTDRRGGGAVRTDGLVGWGKRLAFFHLVCVGWVFFRADGVGDAARVFASIATRFSFDGARFDSLLFYCLPLFAVQALQWRTGDAMAIRRIHWAPRGAAYAALWFLMTLMGDYSSAQFIYFQF